MSVANEEHLKILKQGVDAWNYWRLENLNVQPNFRGAVLSRAKLWRADLSSADLSSANLWRADLSSADLSSAKLSDADLHGVNLSDASLSSADLSSVSLIDANLSDANLSDANLSSADLYGVNLSDANLHGVNLSDASLFRTVLADVDLSTVKGLEACKHAGPSTIDHRTLARSGQLPLAFLRGVGLPDTFIDYIPSLLNQPIQFYSCFISYSHKDEAFAKQLYDSLQGKGIRCWYAPEDLRIGAKFRVDIDQAIRKHDKLLLVLSEHSVNSQWVENEVETALEEERDRKEKSGQDQTVLFPVRLDETVMNSRDGWAGQVKRSRHIGDFTHWKDYDSYQKGFERLVRDLKAALT